MVVKEGAIEKLTHGRKKKQFYVNFNFVFDNFFFD